VFEQLNQLEKYLGCFDIDQIGYSKNDRQSPISPSLVLLVRSYSPFLAPSLEELMIVS